jgi:hypothetical protein
VRRRSFAIGDGDASSTRANESLWRWRSISHLDWWEIAALAIRDGSHRERTSLDTAEVRFRTLIGGRSLRSPSEMAVIEDGLFDWTDEARFVDGEKRKTERTEQNKSNAMAFYDLMFKML